MKPIDAVKAIRAFREAVRGNVSSAGQVANRAAVCASCSKRVPTTGVSRMSALLGRLSGKHGVPSSVSGFSCGVCGCNLLLLLPATKENIHQDSEAEAKVRPENCWIKTL